MTYGRYGAKCHLCTHLLGPSHDAEPDVWPLPVVTGCERCRFCQEAAFSRFVSDNVTLDMFDPEVRAAVVALRDHKPHPLIDQLRAEIQNEESAVGVQRQGPTTPGGES